MKPEYIMTNKDQLEKESPLFVRPALHSFSNEKVLTLYLTDISTSFPPHF